MSDVDCSLLECATEDDRSFAMQDYAGPLARWCAGCGDHSILAATERLLEAEQLAPERTVFVSGIGCSSRFPHYLKTYGFHGVHGRALPMGLGVKLARPELHVFVVMGDGDCCSIGAGHWVHAVRYNTDLVALLLDNHIYALTKKQTSPTTPQGFPTNTQPQGSFLNSLNPLSATLGITNASFVAQTADWVPMHLAATLDAAYRHKGFSFVRILQRCPVWTPGVFLEAAQNPAKTELLLHDEGIRVPELESIYKSHIAHDPSDIHRARELAEDPSAVRLGLFYCNPSRPRYDEIRRLPHHTVEEKIKVLEAELDRHAV